MDIPSYIKQKPKFFRWIPFLNKPVANSIYPYIFLPNSIWEVLMGDKTDITIQALIIHEEVHITRQKHKGVLLYWFLYIFSSSFRWSEEKRAVREAVYFLKSNEHNIDISEMNTPLDQHFLFLYPVSKKLSKNELKKFVEQS